MPDLIMITADLVAFLLLSIGINFVRHRRRDLVVAFIGVNIGVIAVAEAPSDSSAARRSSRIYRGNSLTAQSCPCPIS
ncbi:hypothetical protein [Leucobacter celer]|uniref:hypothetical protein n=1 Tax=Leucobacter celer TaxID=668625 RepID=UPI0006A795E1|nr:hypothetical protein [Leucobacter celer]